MGPIHNLQGEWNNQDESDLTLTKAMMNGKGKGQDLHMVGYAIPVKMLVESLMKRFDGGKT